MGSWQPSSVTLLSNCHQTSLVLTGTPWDHLSAVELSYQQPEKRQKTPPHLYWKSLKDMGTLEGWEWRTRAGQQHQERGQDVTVSPPKATSLPQVGRTGPKMPHPDLLKGWTRPGKAEGHPNLRGLTFHHLPHHLSLHRGGCWTWDWSKSHTEILWISPNFSLVLRPEFKPELLIPFLIFDITVTSNKFLWGLRAEIWMWATGILGNATLSSFLNSSNSNRGLLDLTKEPPGVALMVLMVLKIQSHTKIPSEVSHPSSDSKLLIVLGKESDTIRPEMMQSSRPQSPLSPSAVKSPDQRSPQRAEHQLLPETMGCNISTTI